MKLDLKFTTRSFYKLETEHDIKVTHLDFEDIGFSDIIHIVWAGMQHHDPAPSVDDVIEKVDIRNMEDLVSSLEKAITEAFPKAEEDQKN